MLVRILQGVMHVEVVAVVTKPEQIRSDVTNTFIHFVLSTDVSDSSQTGKSAPEKLKRVLLGTREEVLRMLQFAP